MSFWEGTKHFAWFVAIIIMFFVCGMFVEQTRNQRTDCATLCINNSCVETCPATTRMVRQ